jgi:hypothetical protein
LVFLAGPVKGFEWFGALVTAARRKGKSVMDPFHDKFTPQEIDGFNRLRDKGQLFVSGIKRYAEGPAKGHFLVSVGSEPAESFGSGKATRPLAHFIMLSDPADAGKRLERLPFKEGEKLPWLPEKAVPVRKFFPEKRF